jgi:alanine racemase
VVAVWSHLSHAEQVGHPTTDVQADLFDKAWKKAVARGMHPLRHLANSAAIRTRPDLHYDIVRSGIAVVVGLDPLDRAPAQSPFRPTMTLRAPVVQIRRVPAGKGVSYDHRWTTPHETTLAIVQIGQVMMDQLVVDLGPEGPGAVREGDMAVLFGPGDHGEPTAHEIAEMLGGTDPVGIALGVSWHRVERR